jgi:hypothetical protein
MEAKVPPLEMDQVRLLIECGETAQEADPSSETEPPTAISDDGAVTHALTFAAARAAAPASNIPAPHVLVVQ